MLEAYLGGGEPTLSEVVGVLLIAMPMFAAAALLAAWHERYIVPMMVWGFAAIAAFMLLTGQKDIFPQSGIGWVFWASAIPLLGTIAVRVYRHRSHST